MAYLMKDHRVFLSTTLYGLLGFAAIVLNEVIFSPMQCNKRSHDLSQQNFPLLMVTDHHNGGYDMDDNEIGILLSIAAFFQVSYQVQTSQIIFIITVIIKNVILIKEIYLTSPSHCA